MTDIPDRYIEEALRLTGSPRGWTLQTVVCTAETQTMARAILAHAQTLQERDAERQDVSDAAKYAVRWLLRAGYDAAPISRFILPKVDPDEELAHEVAKEFAPRMVTPYPPARLEALEEMALATIRAYKGRITDG